MSRVNDPYILWIIVLHERNNARIWLQSIVVTVLVGCGDAAPAPEIDTWESFASEFMAAHCTRCHQGDHSGGDYTVYAEVAADAAPMRCGVAAERLADCDDTMPAPRSFPTGPRPPEDDIERLVAWIEAGLPRE